MKQKIREKAQRELEEEEENEKKEKGTSERAGLSDHHDAACRAAWDYWVRR